MKDSETEAKAYAFKLLGYRARSTKEMRERLERKGFSADRIDTTIKYLEDIRLLNDKELAADLFRYSLETKPLGKNGIRVFLSKRGIDKDTIEKNLSGHTSDMEEKTAAEFAGRKMRVLGKHPENVIRRRLWGMLQRRGFSYDVTRRVVDSVLQDL